MARLGRKSKSTGETEKGSKSNHYLNAPKKRKVIPSELTIPVPNTNNVDESVDRISNTPETTDSVRKSSRTSIVSQTAQKGKAARESSLASKRHEDTNNEDENMEVRSNKTVTISSKASPVSQKSSNTLTSKRKSISSDTLSKKKKKVLKSIPRLPEAGGDLLGLGTNDEGQLGLTLEVSSAARPRLLKLEHNVVSVVAGGMHTVYLSETGEVYTFGCNDERALGRETTDDDASAIPAKVDIPESVVQISAGDSHSAALTTTGKVYIWGNYRDSKGQMGLTSNGRQDTPLQILKETKIVRITSGDDHFVCLSEEGVLYTCGCAEQGQLGRLAECFTDRGGRRGIDHVLTPTPVFMKRNRKNVEFDEVWTGSYTTFAREIDTGDIYGFGLNNYNQLGLPNEDIRFCPELITSFRGKKWKMIGGGQHHTIALDENGKVYSMGRKEYGRLGLGENCEDKSEPTCIPLLADKKCTCICAGTTVSFAVTDDGKVYSWGMGDSSQLGHGSEDDVISPQLICSKSMSARFALSVSAGGQHAMIIARNLEEQKLSEDNSKKITASEEKENPSNKEQST